MGDYELLQNYLTAGSDEAFAEVMRRHAGLVYSAARRQVRSPQLAEDVTQTVFFDLARSAGKIKSGQPLAAWLFLVTRRTAIDALRRETRQRAREQQASELAAMKNSPSAWNQIEPLLDEAVSSLSEIDRRALLLRFFENKSLRDVGHALGASEDAAQKRVTRAIDQLRRFFGKQGVVISAAALATDLSAQAVQSAPAALVSTLLASTPAVVASAGAVSHIVFMTTLKKVGLSTALVLLVGVGVYEIVEGRNQRDTLRALQRETEALRSENGDLRAQRDDTAAKLASVRRELAEARLLATAGDPAVESALEAWLERVQAMKRWLEKMPDKRIPQMALLTEDDWLDAARTAKLETELGVREALAKLRLHALQRFSRPTLNALKEYAKANNNQFPTDAGQLARYFDPPVDVGMLQNFEVRKRPSSTLQSVGTPDKATKTFPAEVTLASKVVDDIYEFRQSYGASGTVWQQSVNLTRDAISEAVKKFRAANNGRSPQSPGQLGPFFDKPVDGAYVAHVFADLVNGK